MKKLKSAKTLTLSPSPHFFYMYKKKIDLKLTKKITYEVYSSVILGIWSTPTTGIRIDIIRNLSYIYEENEKS